MKGDGGRDMEDIGRGKDFAELEDVLQDLTASFWLKAALRSLRRDPVDAVNDAEFLARILDKRIRRILR